MKSANRCRRFQKDLLDDLKGRSYSELIALPVEQVVPSQQGFYDWRVRIIRDIAEQGRVKVTVEARKRSLLVFLSVSSPSFEMLPDGTIVEDEVEIDD